jgi:hypothetical protein
MSEPFLCLARFLVNQKQTCKYLIYFVVGSKNTFNCNNCIIFSAQQYAARIMGMIQQRMLKRSFVC